MQLVSFRLSFTPFRDEVDLYYALVELAKPYVTEETTLFVFPGRYCHGWLAQSVAERDRPEQYAQLERVYREAGAKAAKTLGAWLVPGTVLAAREEGVVEIAAVFAPDGTTVGEQVAVHGETPGAPGGEVWVPVPTDLGRVGLLLGQDAFMPEAARILTLLGAEILVAPLARRHPYPSVQAMAGLWQLCQQNQAFGLESGLAGQGLGEAWDGKAALFAPCELTKDGSGFLGRPGYLIRDGAVAGTASLSELKAVRRQYPLFRHLNPALYRRYLPELYGGSRFEP